MRRGTVRMGVLALVGCLAVGCTSTAQRPAAEASAPRVERDYWPTDGWRTDEPAAHGFNATELADIDRHAMTSNATLRGVVIIRDGYLLHERYGPGLDAASGHDVRSVTKSVVGALVGIALGDGEIDSLDATVGELLADHLPADADPRMSDVTVRDLLSMTSGLAADDDSLGGDGTIFDALWASPDWVRHILGQRLATDPGSAWAYSNAGTHLLSAIVADATGGSTLQFARRRLFGPLGISADQAFEPVLGGPMPPPWYQQFLAAGVAWAVDPQGYNCGGLGLLLPARELAKIGFLYLNGGRWAGEQIVPADYVRASTRRAADVPNDDADYGWLWWLERYDDHPAFFALGYGGSVIHVVPDLDLVTVVTGDPQRPGLTGGRAIAHEAVKAAED